MAEQEKMQQEEMQQQNAEQATTQQEKSMQRLVVIGATGSGKTTLGRRAAEKLGLPLVDLDELHWMPGWKARLPDEFHELTEQATDQESWVVCGNYSHVRDAVWPKADALIWLDYPFMLVLRRLLVRTFKRIHDKQEVCNGNVETWGQAFSKDSILVWLFSSYWRRKEAYQKVFRDPGLYPKARYIRLKSPQEAENWLAGLKPAATKTKPEAVSEEPVLQTQASA